VSHYTRLERLIEENTLAYWAYSYATKKMNREYGPRGLSIKLLTFNILDWMPYRGNEQMFLKLNLALPASI